MLNTMFVHRVVETYRKPKKERLLLEHRRLHNKEGLLDGSKDWYVSVPQAIALYKKGRKTYMKLAC